MPETSVHLLLLQSARNALETMFFATPDTVSMDSRRPEGELIAVSFAFQGEPPGRFGLMASNSVARILTASFTGCEDGASLLPAQVASVTGELANMVCGAVLSQLESDVSFNLEPPAVRQLGSEEPRPDFSTASASVCRFEFPEGALVFFLTFGKPL